MSQKLQKMSRFWRPLGDSRFEGADHQSDCEHTLLDSMQSELYGPFNTDVTQVSLLFRFFCTNADTFHYS